MAGTYKLGECFDQCEEKNVIGTWMLRLINQGCLTPATKTDVEMMGRTNKEVDMQFVKPPADSESCEYKLYNIIQAASGKDGILQEKELENYCKGNPSVLRELLDRWKGAGENYVYDKHCFKATISKNINNLTDEGKKEFAQMAGLKNYLTDFTLLSERGVEESFVWQDYMEYAMLMGMARQVIKDLKKMYPHQVPEIEFYERNISMAYHYNMFTYYAMRNAESAVREARFSGSGGGASFGGGGGFSGGGFGGGSR